MGARQTATIPATSAGSVQDIVVTPTPITGYTPIAVCFYNITHPLAHELRSYYPNDGVWTFRISSAIGTSNADTLHVSFVYIRNDLL